MSQENLSESQDASGNYLRRDPYQGGLGTSPGHPVPDCPSPRGVEQLSEGSGDMDTGGCPPGDLDAAEAFFANLAREIGSEEDYLPTYDVAGQDPCPIRPSYFEARVPDFEVDAFCLGRLVFHHCLPNTRAIRRRLLDYGWKAYGPSSDRAGFLAAEHNDHIHILHGCNPTTNNSCRCTRFWGAKPFFTRVHEPADLSTGDVIRMWNYLVSEDGRRIIFWTNSGGQPIAYYSSRAAENGGWETPQTRNLDKECQSIGMEQPGSGSGTGNNGQSVFNETSKKVSLATKCSEIWAVAEREWLSEVSSILNHPDVVERYEDDLEASMDTFEKRLINKRRLNYAKTQFWRFEDFYNKLKSSNASFGIRRDKLQVRASTFAVLVHWMESQFGPRWPLTYEEMIRAFDGDNGKLNTLVFVGPPSCGKTWLVTMFAQLARYTGYVRNWSDGDKFCFDNLANCRFLVHDECQFPMQAPEYFEAYKLLAAGQSPIVNVKFKSGTKVAPAPLFIMANKHPLTNCTNQIQFFDDIRWKVFYLDAVEDFKDMSESKYGNPLALLDLYDYAQQLIQTW